jgi:outer membrane protein assembly factor BamA
VYVGGNKTVLGQFELGLPIGKTATFAAFLDAGGSYFEDEQIGTDKLRVAAGLEFRVFLPVFQAPIRLIYGWPLRSVSGDRTNRFQFSIGLPF